MLAPPWFSVPPRGYGGTEEVLAGLVNSLVARGHHVILIGSGPRLTTAQEFVAVYDDPPSSRLGDPMPEVVHAAAAGRILAELDVDIVHDHTLAGPLTARASRSAVVVTAHGPLSRDHRRYFRELGGTVNLVAISDSQRQLAPHLTWAGRVHNGVDVATFPLGDGAGGYLLFIGRF
ncbi:MAG: glycosyl transferase group 1, partial [Marmoricola sp.]|nr:glycosyl transferase group 1 [Marmoricola sp.]